MLVYFVLMIADITITEKSFGDKVLMTSTHFSIDDGEKVGLIGRNGVGKSTLFGILAGQDKDFTGNVIFRRGVTVVATSQEHHGIGDITVVQYILSGLPEYTELSHVIYTFPETMGDNMRLINEYTRALDRFGEKGFYHIEDVVREELKNFQLDGYGERPFKSLSGGQKRLVEVIKIMHSSADLALIDEPTNHMDYVAKQQFIEWTKDASEAMLVISHDRDVLKQVDRVIELRDGEALSFKGDYDAYLSQNAVSTATSMSEYEIIQSKIANLKKRVQYARSKKAAWGGTADKKNPFVVMEEHALAEIKELERHEKPSFWIDEGSVKDLNYKHAARYQKYKAKNIRLNVKNNETRSKRILVETKELALGYADTILFEGVHIDLREGEAVELRGRNGAGKTTLIRALLGSNDATVFDGTMMVDPHARVGVYEQELSPKYLDLPLAEAIEQMYLDKDLSISPTKIRQLMADYLFVENDGKIPLRALSGGQKARFQIIAMLANEPDLLILDEPTNHLDLPSIEELENALERYTGAVLYVSHDSYFSAKLGGMVVQIGRE